jgi:pimeloyl-ACP methyl ester carboxylesterase
MIAESHHPHAMPRLSSVACISPSGMHRMAYQEWGDPANPEVVVCVHGLTRSGDDFAPLAASLSDRYRVVCPDVVGRGRSSWLKNPMLYGVPQYAADMTTLIARLGVESVLWVGTSMGGLIGMTLAAMEGGPIRRLILNDVGAVLSAAALSRIGSYVGVNVEFDSRSEARQALRSIFSGFGPHSDAQWLHLTDTMLRDIDGSSRVRLHYDPAIAEPFRKAYPADAPPGSAPADITLWPIYDAIACPTLVLRGVESDLLSADILREMSQRGPRAQTREFAGIGHAPTLMSDEQIAIVRSFLEGAPLP